MAQIENQISAIILAAGESRRMGYPKALADFQGRPFLQTIIDNFKKGGISDVIVVLGYHAAEIRRRLNLLEECIVINENYQLGQFSSFQTGVKHLSPQTKGVFLALVDQPQIPVEVITKLASTFQSRSDKICIPVVRSHRGHPSIFPRNVYDEILAASPKETAKDIISKHADDILEVEVDDERILWNLNTPEDLEKAQAKVNNGEELQLG